MSAETEPRCGCGHAWAKHESLGCLVQLDDDELGLGPFCECVARPPGPAPEPPEPRLWGGKMCTCPMNGPYLVGIADDCPVHEPAPVSAVPTDPEPRDPRVLAHDANLCGRRHPEDAAERGQEMVCLRPDGHPPLAAVPSDPTDLRDALLRRLRTWTPIGWTNDKVEQMTDAVMEKVTPHYEAALAQAVTDERERTEHAIAVRKDMSKRFVRALEAKTRALRAAEAERDDLALKLAQAEAHIEAARALHHAFWVEETGNWCFECRQPSYPCPTVAALGAVQADG